MCVDLLEQIHFSVEQFIQINLSQTKSFRLRNLSKMEKETKRFSRQSTADLTSLYPDTIKQVKIERKQRPNIPKPPQKKKQLLNPFKRQQSTITHLTKLSVIDKKNTIQSEGRAKSLTVKYIGTYKQPGVFNLNDKQFMELYENDPFARYKIDYILKKNDEKMQKDKALANTINAMNISKSKDKITQRENSTDIISQHKRPKSYVKCKSWANLIEAAQCERYKDLIVSHSQTYSGSSD